MNSGKAALPILTMLLPICAGAQFTPMPASPFSAGANPQSIAAADLNLDGRPDLIVVNSGSNNVSVLLAVRNGGYPFI
jgi:hypothetical protein